MFAEKICSCLNSNKNNNDIYLISNALTSLLTESNNELFPFIKSFLDIFDNIKIYEDNSKEEKDILKKISESLSNYKDFFINTWKEKNISFLNFRALLNDKDIILDDEVIEYLIYRMKKDCLNIISKNKNNNKDVSLLNNDDKNKNIINEENKINKENKLENTNDNIEHQYSIFDLNYKTFLDFIK